VRRLSRKEAGHFALEGAQHAATVHRQGSRFPDRGKPHRQEDGDDFVIQGWTVTVPGEVAELLRASGKDAVPPNEGLIRFPKRLAYLFTGDAG
jgi:hypothetical protein